MAATMIVFEEMAQCCKETLARTCEGGCVDTILKANDHPVAMTICCVNLRTLYCSMHILLLRRNSHDLKP